MLKSQQWKQYKTKLMTKYSTYLEHENTLSFLLNRLNGNGFYGCQTAASLSTLNSEPYG